MWFFFSKFFYILFFCFLFRKLFFNILNFKLINGISKITFSIFLGRFQNIYFIVSLIYLLVLIVKLLFQTLDCSFSVYYILFLIYNLFLRFLQFKLQTNKKIKIIKIITFQHSLKLIIDLIIHNWAILSFPANCYSKIKFSHFLSSKT